MTPEGRQDLAAVIAEMREVIAERLLCNISQQKGRVVAKETLERWLALLLAEAPRAQATSSTPETLGETAHALENIGDSAGAPVDTSTDPLTADDWETIVAAVLRSPTFAASTREAQQRLLDKIRNHTGA